MSEQESEPVGRADVAASVAAARTAAEGGAPEFKRCGRGYQIADKPPVQCEFQADHPGPHSFEAVLSEGDVVHPADLSANQGEGVPGGDLMYQQPEDGNLPYDPDVPPPFLETYRPPAVMVEVSDANRCDAPDPASPAELVAEGVGLCEFPTHTGPHSWEYEPAVAERRRQYLDGEDATEIPVQDERSQLYADQQALGEMMHRARTILSDLKAKYAMKRAGVPGGDKHLNQIGKEIVEARQAIAVLMQEIERTQGGEPMREPLAVVETPGG